MSGEGQVYDGIKDAFTPPAFRLGDAINNVEAELFRPSVLFRPKLSIDGNKWCALYGDNLQDGVGGFGDSPDEAMRDFDNAWRAKIEPAK